MSGPEIAERLRAARLRTFLDGGNQDLSADELDSLLRRTAEIYSHAVSERTRADYARRWALFVEWCRRHQVEFLPCAPETVMLYMTDSIAAGGVSLSTLRGWMAAINRVHLEAGLTTPGEDPAMRMFLRGLSRIAPAPARTEPIAALRIEALRRVCQHIDATGVDLKEVRDRAVLGLHLAGVGDGEMSRLDWEQVSMAADTIVLAILPIGRQVRVRERVAYSEDDTRACPVHALQAWRAACGPEPSGPVFRVVESGWVGGPMVPKSMYHIRRWRRLSLGAAGDPADARTAMRLLGQASSIALRDRALLLLGFAGAFRRNEVSELRWSDIRERDAGLIVHLRRSKTDLAGRGRDVGIPLGKSALTCPVSAVRRWRSRVEEQLGTVEPESPVFVHVGRSGRITDQPLTPEGLTLLVQRRAIAAGLDGRWGGRSLRAGFISTAADLEIPLESIAQQSRHATLDTLALYIRRENPFRRNPAGQVGL